MESVAKKINYFLDQTKQVKVVVSELTPWGAQFPSLNSPDGVMKCHRFKGKWENFPEASELQWCNANPTVTEFKNGDTILIQPGKPNVAAGVQSVSFIQVVPKQNQRQMMQDIADGKTLPPPATPVKHLNGNANPQVMGSLWSICIGHAIQFNKDRVDAKGKPLTMKDVLMDAALLENDFKQKMSHD